jgi:hypothetical protein
LTVRAGRRIYVVVPRGIPNKKRGRGRPPTRRGRGPSKVKLQDIDLKIDELIKAVEGLSASLARSGGKPNGATKAVRPATVVDDNDQDDDVDDDTYLDDDEEDILKVL